MGHVLTVGSGSGFPLPESTLALEEAGPATRRGHGAPGLAKTTCFVNADFDTNAHPGKAAKGLWGVSHLE